MFGPVLTAINVCQVGWERLDFVNKVCRTGGLVIDLFDGKSRLSADMVRDPDLSPRFPFKILKEKSLMI